MRKLNITLLIVLALALQVAIGVGVYGIATPDAVQVAKEPDKPVQNKVDLTPRYPIPAQVQPIVSNIGIDPNLINENQIIVDQGVGICPLPAVSCYSNKKIWIPLSTLNGSQGYSSLAHEYLHFIWFNKLTYQERQDLSAPLNQFYQSNPSFQSRFKDYPPEVIQYELFPVLCTEVSDNKLPSTVLQYCAKYLPNRNTLPSFY